MSAKSKTLSEMNQDTNNKEAISKIRIRLHSFDFNVLDRAVKDVAHLVLKAGGKVVGPVPIKTKKKVVVLLKSTFKHKDARFKIESRVHKRLLDIVDFNSQVVNSLSTMSLPAGVDVDIQML
jgi:small subunit ribosomal protein S10